MRIKGNLKRFLASVAAFTFIIANLPMNLVKATAEELSNKNSPNSCNYRFAWKVCSI